MPTFEAQPAIIHEPTIAASDALSASVAVESRLFVLGRHGTLSGRHVSKDDRKPFASPFRAGKGDTGQEKHTGSIGVCNS